MDPLLCNWDSASFLIFSDNVFGPLIYYSHFFALIPSLIVGWIIFSKDTKALINRIFFFITTAFSLWVFMDLVLWANEKSNLQMFVWSTINVIEPMIYAACLYFIYVFLEKEDLSFNKKFIIALLMTPVLLLASTKYALVGFDLSNCNREVTEGPVALYGYIIEIIYVIGILFFAVRKFLSTKALEEKKQVLLITSGVVLFLVLLSLGNIVGSFTDDWVIAQYGLFGMPIFLIFLSYMVVKFQTFNIKVVGAQILVAALVFLVFAILFIRKIENVRIVVIFTLAAVGILGYSLVRSVKKEVEQREEIATLAEDVKRAYVIEKRAKEEIERLDKFKDQFLMTTQHNLRTPLTSMMGYSDLLLKGVFGKQNKKTIEVIGKFQTLTQGMIKMVNDFLNMAQFQLGRDVLAFKPGIDLSPILQEIMTELEFKAKTKKIYLKMEKPETLPTINADREKLKAALFNVIDNAVKYTVKGGVSVAVENNATSIKIVVSDTGIGIPKEEMKNLFDSMFSRGEQAKRLDTVGSGVGLYLSAQIVKAHKGRVWVESGSEGSTFYIELPVTV
jgi:signal transduction histidine kinase